jgi:transposase-like protein
MTRRNGRRWTLDEQDAAVARVDAGETPGKVARGIGASRSTVERWVRMSEGEDVRRRDPIDGDGWTPAKWTNPIRARALGVEQ